MHAYMSDRDGRRQAADLPRVEWLAWSAESEARAILAETEPETLDTALVPASSLRWYDVTPREASYRLMLAEAIAGFIGAEV